MSVPSPLIHMPFDPPLSPFPSFSYHSHPFPASFLHLLTLSPLHLISPLPDALPFPFSFPYPYRPPSSHSPSPPLAWNGNISVACGTAAIFGKVRVSPLFPSRLFLLLPPPLVPLSSFSCPFLLLLPFPPIPYFPHFLFPPFIFPFFLSNFFSSRYTSAPHSFPSLPPSSSLIIPSNSPIPLPLFSIST